MVKIINFIAMHSNMWDYNQQVARNAVKKKLLASV